MTKNNKEIKDKFILDACCGGRMMWFNKSHLNTIYIDNRVCEKGHNKREPNHEVNPDIVMDFRNLKFNDGTFDLVVFDPPHLFLNKACNVAKDYGTLKDMDWKNDIKKGFSECFRVLKERGILIFKWNEFNIPLKDILQLTDIKPLFGNRSGKSGKTHWLCFMKITQQ